LAISFSETYFNVIPVQCVASGKVQSYILWYFQHEHSCKGTLEA